MNGKHIRKLLATLVACAMLLTSVAAFAEGAVGIGGGIVIPKPDDVESVEAEIIRGDDDAVEADETNTTETETDEPETTEPETTDPELIEPEVTEPETTEPEITEPETGDTEDTDTEDADTADADDGIALMSLVPCEHDWDVIEEGTTTYYSEYNGRHQIIINGRIEKCKKCGDQVEYSTKSTYELCSDEDEDGICDECEWKMLTYTDPKDCKHDGGVYTFNEWSHDETCPGETIPASYRNDIQAEVLKNDPAAGHHINYTVKASVHCEKCYVVLEFLQQVVTMDEPHTFDGNGKCVYCGYQKPAEKTTTAKKAADTRVRAGKELQQQIRALVSSGASVSLTDEALAYTEAEFAAVSAVTDPVERALMLLAALGYGDEVDYMVKQQRLNLSDAARAVIDQLKARGATASAEAAAAFLTTATVNGKTCDAVRIQVMAAGSTGISTQSFTFYIDGGKLYVAA